MKTKQISVFLASLMGLTAFAQVSSLDDIRTDRAYTIHNPYYTAYAVYNAQKSSALVWAAGMTSSDKNIADDSYKAALDASSPSSSWMIVNYNDEWYVYNLGAEKFLAVGHDAEIASTASAKLQDTPVAVKFTQKASGEFHLHSYDGNKNYLCAAPQLAYPVSIWSNTDNGATWQITENPAVEADYETCMAKLAEAFPETVALDIDARHGYVWSTKTGGAMPDRIPKGRDFTFYTRSRYGWNCNDGLTIRHGNEQYVVTDIADGAYATEITIPAEKVDGDICISGTWERDGNTEKALLLTFSDEFEGTGEPASESWSRAVRQGSTWNRWCSDSPLVVYCEDGVLHCRAIPNPDTASDNVPMITGGVKTQGKFAFQWGRAEARIKTIQHTGNFPAFWMMPADNSLGWPKNGEIDIWEAIDNDTRAYGTIHTNWTYNLGHGGNGSSMAGIDYDLWHIYAVEWDAMSITWYVDNQKMWTYSKSSDQNALDQGQWPFDAPFYLILNQSVGNGSWAKPADTSFTYETLFDWVRVYQKPETVGIGDVLSGSDTEDTSATCYDLSGRKVVSAAGHGVFISNGQLILR
ncbi:MAG: glycoside hydrolase family 16 protein [Paraprevotella sp.]|nr:glycoside hydrolase family 16 protein [Paraprevotella sp.]